MHLFPVMWTNMVSNDHTTSIMKHTKILCPSTLRYSQRWPRSGRKLSAKESPSNETSRSRNTFVRAFQENTEDW